MVLQNEFIRFDWAVKRLLRNKANFGMLMMNTSRL